ncbi:11539_t:CDS:1, partial [Dentiscutata erythropus]
VNTERSQRKKDLRTFWQGVIEECGRAKRKRDDEEKENLNPSKKHAQSVISLMCLIQGNSLTNAFEVDIEKNKTISKLKDAIKKKNARTFSNIDAKDIKLWKVEIPDNRNDQLNNFSFHDQDELLAMKKISKYFPFTLPEEHVHVIVKLPRKC